MSTAGTFSLLVDKESHQRNRVKSILIALSFVTTFVAGGLFVAVVFIPSNNYDDISQFTQLYKSIDWSKFNDSLRAYDEHQMRSKRSIPFVPGDSIKLVLDEMNRFVGTRGRGYHLIDKWMVEESFPHSDVTFQFDGKSTVTVNANGIYLILLQLTFTMGRKTSVAYEIRKSSSSSKDETKLAYCRQEKMNIKEWDKQCHTAVTTQLNVGDIVKVYVQKANFTIDEHQGRSFFSITLLLEQ